MDCGNLHIRCNNFRKLSSRPTGKHKHKEDHVWFLWKGSAKLWLWKPDGSLADESGDYHVPMNVDANTLPVMVNVPAGWDHDVWPLAPNSAFVCIFTKFLPDGSKAVCK